jgi:imidazole glycerol-phosphate synthase subunit HisH
MNAGPSIAVVDYGMGNRRSVQKALEHVGARAEITSQHDSIRRADGVVVPGVGAFPLAMERLNQSGLSELILELAGQDTPILGICLGMQLLFERSEELGSTAGLGLIAGDVKWLDSAGLRIPHIGWNEVRFERSSPLTEGIRAGGAPFYHVHSLAAHPRDPADVVGSTEYGERFATIVARGSIYGVQFHPEKSSRHGLEMLGNFAAICARRPVRAG